MNTSNNYRGYARPNKVQVLRARLGDHGRISISDITGLSKRTKRINRNYDFQQFQDQVNDYLTDHGYHTSGVWQDPNNLDTFYFVVTDLTPLEKATL